MICNICKDSKTEHVYSKKNDSFVNIDITKDLNINYCKECNAFFQKSAYDKNYDKYIDQIYSKFHKSDFFNFPNKSEENLEARDYILSSLTNSKKKLNILEIGSNRGDLLYLIKEKKENVNILGIEPTKFIELKVPTINSLFSKKLFSNKFDVIILQHVLEHIKYPKDVMSDVVNLLSDNGLLYIEVPYICKNLKKGIEDFSLEHVNYFSLLSLYKMLKGVKLLKSKRDYFLKTIWKKTDVKKIKEINELNIKKELKIFLKNKKKIKNQVKIYSKTHNIVFYGISYYFRLIFNELKSFLKKENCYYIDDQFFLSNEPSFELRAKKGKIKNSVIIICSNNYKTQNKMIKKLKFLKSNIIVLPWHSIKKL